MLPLLLRIASGVTGVSVEEIKSKSRVQRIVEARQISAYVLRKGDEMTYTEIGACLKRDHSTAIHACQTIEEQLNARHSPAQARTADRIKGRIDLIFKAEEEAKRRHQESAHVGSSSVRAA